MQPWDLAETYALVRTLFGIDQERLARASTRSVNDRKSFASYHFNEAMRLCRAFERRHLSDTKTLLELHTQGAEKKRQAFEVYMIKAGAHSLAAVQSIHALPDILAHSIYFAAGQNLNPGALAESEISLPRVSNVLKRDASFKELAAPLAEIQSGAGWRHLAAVSNSSKHRSVVRSTLNEDWTGTRKNFRELHVSAFERQGVHFPAKSMKDLLEPEFDRISIAIVNIGTKLNACLRVVAA